MHHLNRESPQKPCKVRILFKLSQHKLVASKLDNFYVGSDIYIYILESRRSIIQFTFHWDFTSKLMLHSCYASISVEFLNLSLLVDKCGMSECTIIIKQI